MNDLQSEIDPQETLVAPRAVPPSTRPVTLADLSREGKLLWCWCADCGRERDIDPASVPLPGDYAVPEVGARMVCSACGGRKVRTSPELYPGGIEAQRARFRK